MAKSKSITIEFDTKTYDLMFTRKVIETMERRGFRISELLECQATQIPMLVHGAFQCRHKYVTQEKAMQIYSSIRQRDEFLSKLVELYQEPLRTLTESPEELETSDEGNGATWTANF